MKVGIIDSGIDQNSPAFNQNLISESHLSGSMDETPASWRSIRSYSHGTAVASIISNVKGTDVWSGSPGIQNAHFHGVSWGVTLEVISIPLGSGGGDYSPINPSRLQQQDNTWNAIFANALSKRIDFLNLSFGYAGTISAYSEQQIRQNFAQTIATLAQARSGKKTILVWAAGNARDRNCVANPLSGTCSGGKAIATSPEILTGMMARIDELRGHSIAVVAVDAGGDIASFSNRCGIAANWCISAPGHRVSTTTYGAAEDPNNPGQVSRNLVRRGVAQTNGTSFAAPFVTGGLALMKNVFRSQLSNTQLVARLFATANKSGKYANRSTYGQGLMDLGAATSIVGNPVITNSASVNSSGHSLTNTGLQLGTAFGDALQRSLNTYEVVAFDRLNAPFWFDLSDFIGSSGTSGLSESLHHFMNEEVAGKAAEGYGSARWEFAPSRLNFNSSGRSSGHLGLAKGSLTASFDSGNNLALAFFATPDNASQSMPTMGLAVSYLPSFALPSYLTLGAISERSSLLQSNSSGAFGEMASNSVFFGAGTSVALGDWRLAGEAELGIFNPEYSSGMIKKMSPIITSAFAIKSANTIDSKNSIAFELSQSLRVENGKADFSVPVGRNHEGAVLKSNVKASLSPSGREVSFAVRWDHLHGNRKRFSVKSSIVKDPGHVRDSQLESQVVAAWQQGF